MLFQQKAEGEVIMKQMSKFLLLLCITLLMAGCKLAVIVVEGGEVQSTGSGTCVASTICIVDVTDTNFSESFTAVPYTDWYFHKWNSGDRLFCGGSTDLTCPLSFEGHEESEAVEEMVASSELFYLMPVFKPYQDIITVNGNEWLQPALFTNLSWNDINAVCPEGVCAGVLNGINMNGWTWASVKDMNDLFNYYIGSELLGPGPAESGLTDELESNMFRDGWAHTFEDNDTMVGYVKEIAGWTKNGLNTDTNQAYSAAWSELVSRSAYAIQTNNSINKTYAYGNGAWFYRLP
jgi:hypothetical protein